MKFQFLKTILLLLVMTLIVSPSLADSGHVDLDRQLQNKNISSSGISAIICNNNTRISCHQTANDGGVEFYKANGYAGKEQNSCTLSNFKGTNLCPDGVKAIVNDSGKHTLN